MRSPRPCRLRAVVERLEDRCVPATLADPADLFGPTQTANAISTNANPAFAAANLVDGTNAAFRFADGAGAQRLAISNFNAAITTLRFFDTPSYADRAAPLVTIYYSPIRQMSLLPAGYTLLGTFTLPTTNTGGGSPGDVYQTPTSPPDHPKPTDPLANPTATISYDELDNLAIPPGTRSILLDFGANPAGLGFGFSEIQALGYRSPDRPADPTLLAWGQNVYQKTVASLKVPGSNLFSETANINGTRSGGDSGFAYVWPEATMFRVLGDLAAGDRSYVPTMRAFSDELFTRYWQTASPGGYRSGVSSTATRFYDDNGHVAVALAEAYALTGDPVYLTRAIQTYQFVISGEDSAGGGGIYFNVSDHSAKDAISTLQGVRAALLLYQLTGQSQYFSDATRLYTWAATHIQQSNGLYYQHWSLTGSTANTPQGTPLINAAGIGLSDNLLFYEATGDPAYLREAQLVANTSIPHYFNAAGAINDEGYWDFELVDALDNLYLDDRNPAWLTDATGAVTWLHANREDPNGHYGTLWARETYTPGTVRTSWNMIDQAAVAESYLRTGLANTVAPPFVTAAGDPIGGFYQATVGGGDLPSSVGTNSGQYPSTQGPANAVDGNSATKYLDFGNGNSTVSSPSKGVGTGFIVTPAVGPSVVTGIQVVTGDDNSPRDPLTVSVEGTNATSNLDSGAAWTLIAENVDLGIGTDPGRKTYGPQVRFANTTSYRGYRVIVESQRGSANSVQYSELNLLGSAAAPTVQSVVVNGGGAQRSEVRSLTVTFSGPMAFAGGNVAAAFQLNHVPTGNNVTLSAAVATDSLGRTVVTLGFSGGETDPVSALNGGVPSLADGRYQLTVLSGAISGGNGLGLDGDADGTAGGNYLSPADTYQGTGLHLYRLFGDVNGDGVVDAIDLGQFRSAFNANSGSHFYLSFLDADNSGAVDAQDLGQFRSRFNLNVF
jgi:hypothetical protein